MSQVCQYAIIRILPFSETGEFANIGIVLASADRNYFDFALTTKGWGRMSSFFESFDRRIYDAALEGYRRTLERLRDKAHENRRDGKTALELFQDLTRPRNGLIQFSDQRIRIARNPETALKECFDHYVNRNFLEKKAPDVVLERDVRTLLRQEGLSKNFSIKMIGDNVFKISLPFVRFASKDRDEREVTSVIKPLHLAHPKASDITDHGLHWKSRLARLRDRKFISPRVLLPVEGPKANSEGTKAFEQIRADLTGEGFNVVEAHESDKILLFAQN